MVQARAEFSRLLDNHTWHGNLDAFNDLLRGGFGTTERMGTEVAQLGVVSRRTGIRSDDSATGAAPTHLSSLEPFKHRSRILRARSGQGSTLFDQIVEIIREHGPGGSESHDDIVLELA
jgi:hypothetical protein